MIGEGGKSPQKGSLASDFCTLFTMRKRRWTKLFAYSFVAAFVGCTAFLAFNPAGNGSPWFNSLFTSSSFSSSIAPYRSHFNNLISHFFPNSTSSSIEEHNPFVSREVGAQKDGVLPSWAPRSDGSVNGSAGNVILSRNQTEGESSSKKGGSLEKKSTDGGTGLQKNEASSLNLTAEKAKSKKDGVLPEKNQSGGQVPAKNQSEIVLPPEKSGVTVTKNLGKEAAFKGNGVAANAQRETHSDSGNGAQAKSAVATPATIQSRNQTTSSAVVQSRNQTTSSAVAQSRNQTTAVAGTQLKNQTTPSASGRPKNQTTVYSGNSASSEKKGAPESKEVLSGSNASNMSNYLRKGNASAAHTSNGAGKKTEDWIKGMLSCDIFHGRWVKDDSYPLYSEGSCPHIDEPFNCYLNGRSDRAYQKLRWLPDGCKIPRFNALDLLERLRGKRLVFVGDSLNRNMWEAFVCALRSSVKDKKKVFEASGRHEFRTEGSYSILFKDYNCTVEFFRSPFLVQEWEMPDSNGKKKETLRLDIIERSSSRYKDAHIIVFNTGHWWTHEKTSKGRDYYQEGNRVYSELNVVEAFHKALHTWAKWVDSNVNPKKTFVFFRGYSASHFRGGQWNSGGACDRETEPIKNEKYLSPYPPKMRVLETVLNDMKTPVSYLNITRMTDFRKDAHPSIYRKQNLTEEERRNPERFQDCSHWCLPGVPDSWSELLYAQILIKQHQTPSW